MYRDCYTMKLAYPCEADGCRCGSGCLRTRPDCNRIADEDSYSNCDVIPHSGLHRSMEYMPQHDAAHDQGRKVAPSMRRNFAPCGHEKMSLLLFCEVAAPLCGDHEAECSEGQGADTPERRGCTAR